VEIRTPQRGQKKALMDLVGTNAKHSFDARFRVLKPSSKAIQEALQDALNLPAAPARIECFDISHIQGTDKVASMVVWEDGRMKKSDYRKFIIKTVVGNDDFASMREVVTRRYARLLEEKQPMPGLVLIDGGLGQLHAAAEALEAIGIADQPLASIAKREEIIYVYGQEDEPVVLDRFSPILHLVQSIRDEAHRFAVTFHRSRRNARQLTSELDAIAGVGERTVQKLLKEFGSSELVRAASARIAGPVGRGGGPRAAARPLVETGVDVHVDHVIGALHRERTLLGEPLAPPSNVPAVLGGPGRLHGGEVGSIEPQPRRRFPLFGIRHVIRVQERPEHGQRRVGRGNVREPIHAMPPIVAERGFEHLRQNLRDQFRIDDERLIIAAAGRTH
jgi:hypothetical protein